MMRLKSLSVAVILLALVACKTEPLDVDPCTLWPDDFGMLHCVPLIEKKPEYDRKQQAGDTCLTPDEVAKAQKYINEILIKCGKKCD